MTHAELVRARLATLTFPLKVYRGLALGPDEQPRLDSDGLTAWTWDRGIASMYASGDLGYYGYRGDDFGDSVVLVGIIESAGDVDWDETFDRNLRFTDPDDFEETGEHEVVGRVVRIEIDEVW